MTIGDGIAILCLGMMTAIIFIPISYPGEHCDIVIKAPPDAVKIFPGHDYYFNPNLKSLNNDNAFNIWWGGDSKTEAVKISSNP